MIQIDGYEILNPLGAGGMGEVFLANQLATGRKVALKVPLPQYMDDPAFSKQFLIEGQIAAGLNHPHIISIHDVAESAGTAYLAMEYLPSGDLKSMLRNRSNQFMLLNAIHQIAGALTYTHGLGVIHGDVKPQNILFQDMGHAVLSDFGTGLVKREIFGTESVYSVMGSPLYISPEQVRGEQPSHLSDIYGLGVIIYEALMGHPPFLGDSPIETARLRLSAAEAPKLSKEYADYQPFIDHMMARDPENRRLELSDFIGDFHAVMQGNAGEDIEKTQRLSIEEYHQTEDSDFFFIAPTNLSEAQDHTQPIQPEENDFAESGTSLEMSEVMLPGNVSANTVTDTETTAISEYSQTKDEPLTDWVSTGGSDVVLETEGGKLKDLFFFLDDVKGRLKKSAEIRLQNYPHAEDIGLFLRRVTNGLKRKSIIFTGQLSRQSRLLFTTGAVLLSIGIVSVVFSNENAQQQPAHKKLATAAGPSQPVQLTALDSDTRAELTETPQFLFSTEDVNAAIEDTAKTLNILVGKAGKETTREELPQALPENHAQVNKTRRESAKNQQIVLAETIGTTSGVHAAGITELAMLETVTGQQEANNITSNDGLVPEAETKSDLDSGVVTTGGRNVIDHKLEAALGRHVGWMIRRKDGSLSLFVDWVDLMNETSNDFSDEAKKSLDVLGYIIRNYDGFTISISDHSHQQKTVSVARARKVLNYLREQGVPHGRMQTLALLTGNTGNVEMRLIPRN